MSTSHSHSSGFGRRLFPRIAIDGTLLVRDETLNLTMTVQDVSAGGFRTLSPEAVPFGVRHTFEVTQPGAPPLRLKARVAHCGSVLRGRGPYAIGWAFERELETSVNIGHLLNYVTDVTSFLPAATPVEVSSER